ncbi:Alpha-galactosidase [Lachnospiraceae bacterium TWA4]|nr:Alpha-galactosidase [Lachnospiraceae bacterium TWA4]
MAIKFHESTKTFHLFNKEVSYLIHILDNGHLTNLYYGKALRDKEDFTYLYDTYTAVNLPICVPEPGSIKLNYTRQEYPVYGTGDYRTPALTIFQQNGSFVVDFKYASYEIYAGKREIKPLPSTYVESEDEATTLEITLHDEVMDTDLVLTYTIYENYPVITRNARFLHKGSESIVIDRAMSASVEFPDMDFEFTQLSGAWARERYVKNQKLEMGTHSIQSLMGTCSSGEQNPFVALKRPDATETQGEVYGFSFVYSGNFVAQAEVSTHDITRFMMGINPEGFSWKLEAGETFQTPEVVMVYSNEGLNKMSQTYHRLYRTRLVRGQWRDKSRPILLNNWEATYFDFDEEKLLKIAKKASEVGVELFVLDDGWFGARNDDYRGLGDWYVNLEKLPSGIAGLSKKVEELGIKFGLWVELEMVNKDSDLYRAHPDWILHVPGRFDSHQRHQYVLDFSRKEVVDYIYEMIAKILRESSISYIKWDMNRYMTEPYSVIANPCDQGRVMHKYILGVYDLYERLTSEFPEILFESCASGGTRFDPAMLYYAPQTWCSDDTDASERVKIQYGTSYVYPIVSMGSHVSAVPNHQLHRITPIETRAAVAYFGTFGYELDLNLLSDAEIETVKKQIKFMKAHRDLIQIDGDFYRLQSPFEKNEAAWMVVSQDKKEAVVGYYQKLNKVNGSWMRLKLQGLDSDTLYEVSYDISPIASYDAKIAEAYGAQVDDSTIRSYKAYGDELMYAGICIDREVLNKKGGDFSAIIFNVKAE